MTTLFQEMLDARASPSGTRRAALMLHALPAADQRWVIDQLSEPHRQTLDALLGELRQLGIPPGVAADLSRTESSAAQQSPGGSTWSVRADAGRAAALAAALAGEPPLLVDAALTLQEDAVRREVSATLSRPVREGAVVPVRMSRSLTHRLEEHLTRHLDATVPRRVRGAWHERLTLALRRLRRAGSRPDDARPGPPRPPNDATTGLYQR